MAKKQKHEDEGFPQPAWMASYTDLVTLLFCFFVLLYAMSTPDIARFQAMAEAFSGRRQTILELGPDRDSIIDMMGAQGIMDFPLMDQISVDEQERLEAILEAQRELEAMAADFIHYFESGELAGRIEVAILEDGLMVTFGDGVLFDSGRADLKPSALENVRHIANRLLDLTDNHIRIVGHTDNVPIHAPPRFLNNMWLSSARAQTVMDYFTDVVGLEASRISVEGRGEHSPIESNDTAEGRAANRRVEIKIMSRQYTMQSQ
jgi:chemotaxis protein MotB